MHQEERADLNTTRHTTSNTIFTAHTQEEPVMHQEERAELIVAVAGAISTHMVHVPPHGPHQFIQPILRRTHHLHLGRGTLQEFAGAANL